MCVIASDPCINIFTNLPDRRILCFFLNFLSLSFCLSLYLFFLFLCLCSTSYLSPSLSLSLSWLLSLTVSLDSTSACQCLYVCFSLFFLLIFLILFLLLFTYLSFSSHAVLRIKITCRLHAFWGIVRQAVREMPRQKGFVPVSLR